jgi:hypothetical protein
MKRTVIVALRSLLVASAAVGVSYADEAIGPGHARWYGNGTGPVGADLIAWVSQHATKAPSGNPDPSYFGRGGGPTGAELVAKLAKVDRQDHKFDLVNAYGRGAPSLAQLTQRVAPEQPVFAAGSAPVVK